MKIALLSTFNNSLNYFYLDSLYKKGFQNLYLILDSKKQSNKDIKIWKERTNNYFEKKNKIFSKKYINKIKILKNINHNSNDMINIIKKFKFDFLVNVGTPRKIQKKIISICKNKILNIHPGLLPMYRGCTCVEWAIYNDHKIGNTIHFLNEKYDGGNIINKKAILFKKKSSYSDVRIKVFLEGIKLLSNVLTNKKKLHSKKQNEKKAKYWKVIDQQKMKDIKKKLKKGEYKFQVL